MVCQEDSEYMKETTSESETDTECAFQMRNVVNQCVLFKCDEQDYVDITMDMLEEVEANVNQNIIQLSSPNFYKQIISDITETFYSQWLDIGFCDEDDYDDLEELVSSISELYFDFCGIPKRSASHLSRENVLRDIDSLTNTINRLREMPQPVQRTKEWYEFRYNLITASNLWKVFASQSQQNSLIYEKCKPLTYNLGTSGMCNTESTLHWGVKYEPVSVLVYEHMFNTQIEDFGCIPHSTYSFIGASPDGINVDLRCPALYGRMLEIKNICNRDITGIPKEEYWVQTQIQMEVCNLNECDFFETRFKEYEAEEDFYLNTDNHEYRGIILHFVQRTGGYGSDVPNNTPYNNSPTYKYMPVASKYVKDDIDQWISSQKESVRTTHVLYKTFYWYLAEYSCVLIKSSAKTTALHSCC